MTIQINVEIPIEFGLEYYTIEKTVKEKCAPCACCDDSGKVIIKGTQYDCPRCKGNWRKREIIGETIVYSVGLTGLKAETQEIAHQQCLF